MATQRESLRQSWFDKNEVMGNAASVEVAISQAEAVLSALHGRSLPLDIVDVGARAWWFARHLAECGYVTGIGLEDLDDANLVLTRAGYGASKSALNWLPRYYAFSAMAMPRGSGFGAAIWLTTMESPDNERVADKVADLIGPAGCLVCSVVAPADFELRNVERELVGCELEVDKLDRAEVDNHPGTCVHTLVASRTRLH